MEKLKSLKLGETAFLPSENYFPIDRIIASIDEPFFNGDNGKKVERNEVLKVTDQRGYVHFLKVNRILGKDYLVLTRKTKKPKLGFIDALRLAYKLATRRSF